jgi:hypothetical protein
MHGRGETIVQGFGGKARRKEPTWKTKAWVGRWDQRIFWGGGGWCGLDLTSSGQGQWRAVVSAVMNLRSLAPRSYLDTLYSLSLFCVCVLASS